MRLLIVDDSSTMRKILKPSLAGAGFEVAEVKSGTEVPDSVRQNCDDFMKPIIRNLILNKVQIAGFAQ